MTNRLKPLAPVIVVAAGIGIAVGLLVPRPIATVQELPPRAAVRWYG